MAILDRNRDAGQATADALSGAGHKATFHSCDVSDESSVKEAVDQAAQDHGGVNVLVSNAGIQRYGNVVNTGLGNLGRSLQCSREGLFLCGKVHHSLHDSSWRRRRSSSWVQPKALPRL